MQSPPAPNPEASMDNSRVLAAGGVEKRKKARKIPQPNPSTTIVPDVGSSQPVQEPQPLQQVPHQDQFDAMLIDDRFGSDQLHQFSKHFQAAQETNMTAGETNIIHLSTQVERISLADPVHEMLEKAGSLASQIWSTSSWFNNFSVPKMPVEQSEECLALAALKVRLYSLQLREARLAKERDLIVAQTSAEQNAADAFAALETERKASVEEKQHLELELGELRVQLGGFQAKVYAVEATLVRFEETASRILDGPAEVKVDLSAVREAFKGSEQFAALKKDYAQQELPATFGAYLDRFSTGDARRSEGVKLLDQDPRGKKFNDSLARSLYVMGCQHILAPFVAKLQEILGRPIKLTDLPQVPIVEAQFEKYQRDLQRVADREAGRESDPLTDSDEEEGDEEENREASGQ
ncbi:unnamed protein product [Cuscuta europaea]|uniref:Uncharacterized protein n=1 Tax=Cuscuta europaea TaxID=41803 RepID=A0A9P0ZYU4_CUSEU|nr:unnamed protein product [Cuscuta europaea]